MRVLETVDRALGRLLLAQLVVLFTLMPITLIALGIAVVLGLDMNRQFPPPPPWLAGAFLIDFGLFLLWAFLGIATAVLDDWPRARK